MPTIPEQVPSMTLVSLRNSGRKVTLPFALILSDNSVIVCEKILRLVPGKRLVALAHIGHQTVLAKLFFTRKPLLAEREGYPLLQRTGVPTPELLATHEMGEGGACIYMFLPDKQSLDVIWPTLDHEAKTRHFNTLLATLAQCYQAGIYQTDLHLGNFLLSGDTLFAIDPASCQTFASTSTRHDNLALLLAQMPLVEWPELAHCIQQIFPDVALQHLLNTAEDLWKKRKNDYLTKIFRDCTAVADLSHGNRRILCQRHLLSATMQTALDNPQQLLATARVLKAGNSATVLAADIDGKQYVLKRYRNKDLWRTLRRLFRPSRAARSWYFSHALSFAGIDTPAPVALVETRKQGVVTDAWFITEHIEGEDLLTQWNRVTPTQAALDGIGQLFHTLKKTGICHGDMKATNILVANDRYCLIDFDGSRELHGKAAAKAIRHDCERFLRNWDNAVLRTQLQQVLPT